ARQSPPPQAAYFIAESFDCVRVTGDAVVLAVPSHYGPQPVAYLGNRGVPAVPQFGAHLFELVPLTAWHCVPIHHEPSRRGPSTSVNKTQKLKCLWLPVASPLAVASGEPPELQQASLVGVQHQAELP